MAAAVDVSGLDGISRDVVAAGALVSGVLGVSEGDGDGSDVGSSIGANVTGAGVCGVTGVDFGRFGSGIVGATGSLRTNPERKMVAAAGEDVTES